MRSKFPLYSDKLKFSLGMLFNDGKQFKSAIQKYSKEHIRQLDFIKFIKNEPKRIVVRYIASPNCPWRIRASYSPIAKCLQIMTFQDEHHCSGIEIAISDILPRVEHRNCARHVFAKWSGRKLGKSYECDFWQIVK
ncbi:hypothetical protein PVK06_008976 [Gossypium arboreum]|uniref:Transposase MuDR plant domain-containing protein n=1 Tax=Gossypium arboreum TaxID=29729 RepID=A0ABR0QLA1_GOSAR|nr:hypothetical protein PVK06_008976 [Gossypium arboreum]